METTTHDPLADPRRTWRITDDRRLPALEPYADDVRRLPTVTVRETLWDTDDRALAFAGIELVQSTLPAALSAEPDGQRGRWSVDRGAGPEPLDDAGDAVPRDPVEVALRGRAVGPVRVRDTTTTLVRLHGSDGRLRAEVADVHVDEGDTADTLLRSARWWALTDDGRPGALVRAVERALTQAAEDDGHGAADPVPTLAPVRRPPTPPGHRVDRDSAAAFVRAALRSLRTELVAVEPRVRADADDAVHAFRKVLRRLRSVLTAYPSALDPDLTEALRAQLRSTGRVAGTARDAEVVRDRVRAASTTSVPAGWVDAAVLAQLRSGSEERRRSAVAGLAAELRTDGWFRALDLLDVLVDRAPPGPRAGDDAGAFTTRRIARERARVRARIRTALTEIEPDAATACTEQLHDARKAARRLRYALEAAGDLPEVGKRRLGRLRRVQETLGDVLDAEHTADVYRLEAEGTARSGTDTFVHGVLAATELHAAADRRRDAHRALRRLAQVL